MTRILTAALAATCLLATSAAAADWWVKDGINLNARSGPGTNYSKIGSFKSCSKLDVLEIQHGWARISWNYADHWVTLSYLQEEPCYVAPKKKNY